MNIRIARVKLFRVLFLLTVIREITLLFGCQPTLTIDTLVKRAKINSEERTIGDYLSKVTTKFENALEFAKILTDNNHEKNAENHDKNHKHPEIYIGQMVHVRDLSTPVGSTEKVQHKYKGPYEIVDIIDDKLIVSYV